MKISTRLACGEISRANPCAGGSNSPQIFTWDVGSTDPKFVTGYNFFFFETADYLPRNHFMKFESFKIK